MRSRLEFLAIPSFQTVPEPVITLPIPSFSERPLPFFICYLLVVLWLCLWPFNFLQSNQVTWEPSGGLRFTPPATAYTSTPPAKLADLRDWTILMDLKAFAPLRQGRILGYSLDERRANLNIDQVWDDLVLRIRTSETQRVREISVEKLFKQFSDRRFLLAITYDGNVLSIYVDGERNILKKIGPIDHSGWSSTYPMILGSYADGKYGWNGILYGLTVLDHAATPEELNKPHGLLQNTSAVLRYVFDEQNGTTVSDHGSKAPTPLSWRAVFSPYVRTILQSPRDYWPDARRPHIRDIIANLVMYLPMGYLMSAFLSQRYPLALSIVVPIICAGAISCFIEILQAYLPTRNSSSVDLITNGLGAGIGLVVHRKGWIEDSLSKLNVSFRRLA